MSKQQPKLADVKADIVKMKLIQTSAEFVAGYVPPDYLINGLLRKHYLYAMTAPTGAGKTAVSLCITMHAATGTPLDGREIDKSKVLYLVGENPDDVKSRWIKVCEEWSLEPGSVDVCFIEGSMNLGNDEIRNRIDAESAKLGPFDLVVADTSTAYFNGDNENDNVQMVAHAHMLRSLVDIPGGPTVLVLCHPTKSPNTDNLQPRGGGALVAEIDGNLVLNKSGTVVELHHQVKFRGVDFEPIAFKLQAGYSDKLVDSKGRKISTVTAVPISEQEKSTLSDTSNHRQTELLALMKARPGLSMSEQADMLGWRTRDGKPYRSLVQRIMDALARDKLVKKEREKWVLTPSGKKMADDLLRRGQAEMGI